MNKKLTGILTIVSGLIGLIAFYFFVRILMVGDDTLETDAEAQASIIDPFITFSKLVLIATAVLAVAFSIWNLIKHPHVLKQSLIGLGFFVVLLVVAYSVASDAAVTNSVGGFLEGGEAGSVSKWVSTLINFSFILGAIGLVGFLWDFVKSLVK